MKNKRRGKFAKKGKKALAFLRGELLRDAYDCGDRVRRLLWAESGNETGMSRKRYILHTERGDSYDDDYRRDEQSARLREGQKNDYLSPSNTDWIEELNDDHTLILSCNEDTRNIT